MIKVSGFWRWFFRIFMRKMNLRREGAMAMTAAMFEQLLFSLLLAHSFHVFTLSRALARELFFAPAPPWPLVVNQFRSGRIFSLFSTIGIYSYLLCIYRCWINPWKFRWTTRIVLLLLLLYPDFQIKVEAV